MAQDMTISDTDVAVVGSGPGGATVARQLARAGQRVTLLEMGRDYRRDIYYGSHLGALIYGDQHGLLFSEEGLNIIRPIMTGGATNMFCGCSAIPPAWLKERYGVDLDDYAQETIRELSIAPLPDDLQGSASRRVMEAAQDLGHDWQPVRQIHGPLARRSLRLRRQVHAGLPLRRQVDRQRVHGRGGSGRLHPAHPRPRRRDHHRGWAGGRCAWQAPRPSALRGAGQGGGGVGRGHRHAPHPPEVRLRRGRPRDGHGPDGDGLWRVEGGGHGL